MTTLIFGRETDGTTKANLFIIFFAGFVHFADISNDENNVQRLTYDGHKFGFHYQTNNGSNWRCTKAITQNGKRIRCTVKVQTKMINGYTMLKANKAKHNHWNIIIMTNSVNFFLINSTYVNITQEKLNWIPNFDDFTFDIENRREKWGKVRRTNDSSESFAGNIFIRANSSHWLTSFITSAHEVNSEIVINKNLCWKRFH